MAKITNGRQIRTDDFATEERALVQKLAFQLNPFIAEVSNAMQGQISVSDNLNAEYRLITIICNVNGVPVGNNKFKTTIRAQGLPVVRSTGTAFPTASPFISYTQRGDVIEIQHVTGLVPNVEYSLLVLVLG